MGFCGSGQEFLMEYITLSPVFSALLATLSSRKSGNLDNITVGGKTQQEHDERLAKFLKAAQQCNFTFTDQNVFTRQTVLNYWAVKYQKVVRSLILIE